ncbi:MAG: hypothetical protein ABEJ89_05775 [Haloarculaceae archaeon]
MDRSLNVREVAEPLPDMNSLLDDPRLRPLGLVGGFSLVLVGALLQFAGAGAFWATAVAGTLVFTGVPVFCLGLAAPEPEDEDARFRIGVDLAPEHRRIVGGGSLLLLLSPIVVAVLGIPVGFTLTVWIVGAVLTLVGAVLVLTGFIAWSSRAIGETEPV